MSFGDRATTWDSVCPQSTNNPLDVSGDTHYFQTGHTYDWYVVARNDYAWGQAAPKRSFTIAASGATSAFRRFGYR